MEALLAKLEPLLYGTNYQVFLRAYRVPSASDSPPEWYIAQALGPSAVVGGVVSTTRAGILAEVEQSLWYPGDAGSGPRPAVLRSREFAVIVQALLSKLEQAIDGATLLTQFWLREGHPAYPVFWDFAFVIVGSSDGLVVIGSSSD